MSILAMFFELLSPIETETKEPLDVTRKDSLIVAESVTGTFQESILFLFLNDIE